jgi:hypothetical protein
VIVGFLMVQALTATATATATAIAASATPLPVWAKALIVVAVSGVIAVVTAIRGRKQVDQAAPPTPGQTIENVESDVAEIKENAQR